LRRLSVFDEQTMRIREQRESLYRDLCAIEGLSCFPSQANFLLARSRKLPSSTLFQRLKDSGVLVKNLHGAHPMLSDCLRFTVGAADENAALLAALRSALAA
jgi:histidinol-phosphate aminotransferase